MELHEILKLTGAARMRVGLRKKLTPLFEARKELCVSALKKSPLVGTAPNQLDLRAQASSLRDALDFGTLIWLADDMGDDTRLLHVLDAIVEPAAHGSVTTATKTGYLFGRPVLLTEEVVDAIINKHSMKGTEPMTATATAETTKDLSTLIDIFDVVDAETEAEFDNVIVAMKGVLPSEASRLEAVTKAITLRGKRPDVPVLTPDCRTIADHIKVRLSFAAKAEGMGTISKVPSEHEGIINAVLNAVKMPPINELIDKLNAASKEIAELKSRPSYGVTLMPVGATVSAPATTGGKPAGKVTTAKAWHVFGMPKGGAFDFEVPVWEWDFPHPDCKAVDDRYIFRHDELLSALYALLTNERCWLHGHTGTGKTTLIEQIAARLKWPVRVINLDSEITRMDLIGRDTLVNEGGTTVSKFVDGILPQCMVEPYILIFDEFDFIRPDVSYVAQRVLEGNGMTITEDGGRYVSPNPMFRIFATANTQGQGDDYGMYAGARVQSMALLDRFTAWIHVDYLPEAQRLDLLKASVPGLAADVADKIGKYVTEHIEAFKGAKVVKPISPRGMIALGRAVANFTALLPAKDAKKAVDMALERTILNACTQQDKVVLKGIAKRVFV